jgi:hypothetical protein
MLSKQVSEKTGLADPVAEASQALVGGAAIVVRPVPAAYQKVTVPDPFENRHLIRVRTPIPEEPAPPLILPRR